MFGFVQHPMNEKSSMYDFTTAKCIIALALFPHSYNAIKGYTKEGRQAELSATEHLVSAAEAG